MGARPINPILGDCTGFPPMIINPYSFSAPTGASYYDEVIADNPDGYWRLGESSGTTAVDEIGANNGTYINSPTLGDAGAIGGDSDTAITFAGTGNQGVNCGSVANYTTSDFTIEFWINAVSFASTANAVVCVVIFRGQYQQTGYYVGIGTDGSVGLNTNQSGAIQSTGTAAGAVSVLTWNHIVITRQGSTVLIYVNGVDVTSSAGTHTNPDSSPDQFVIGDYNANGWTPNATMDEVAIYSTALSAARVAAHYNAA
jgi:Concanavalin A-like lectin/glucanases superfamily